MVLDQEPTIIATIGKVARSRSDFRSTDCKAQLLNQKPNANDQINS
jgi:hypothetical protein